MSAAAHLVSLRVTANADADLEVVEFATVGQTDDGKIYHRLWSADEITALLKEHDLAKSEETEDK